MADDPNLIATTTLEKITNRLRTAAAAIVAETDPDDLDEDAITSGLHDLADSGFERIAMEAVRSATRAGRADELGEADLPDNVVWRRSSVLEPNTCDPCANADGEEIEGPDADLTEIHEGPPETCLCIPYADLTETGGGDEEEES